MEKTKLPQRPSEWPPQPSKNEPRSSSFRSAAKNRSKKTESSTGIYDDIVVTKKPEPPKPPLSPPTSPPLAVPDATFSPIITGNTIFDTFSTNPLGLGSLGYVATLPPREWFQLLVQKLPLYAFTASSPSRKVIYSRKRDLSSKHAERIRASRVKVVGFDLEWKPMRDREKEYNRVSLVQIATEDEILLVQLPVTEVSKFPLGVQTLLEDPTILKVGAGIQNDVDKLERDWKVKVTNYLDLAFLARYHDYFWDTCDVLNNHCIDGAFGGAWCDSPGEDSPSAETSSGVPSSPDNSSRFGDSDVSLEPSPAPATHLPLEQIHGRPVYPETHPVALARLVSRYLGKRLDKVCQLSNWAAPLNEDQIEYAANDGCSSLDVYNTLIRLRDYTPGWVDAQAMFYRMVIDYHRSLAAPISPYQLMTCSPPDFSQLSLNSSSSTAPGIDETIFTMEIDEFVSENVDISARPSPAVFLPVSGHPQTAKPPMNRSLSDTSIIKVAPAAEGASNKSEKPNIGLHPLYPSPPVTPTHTSIKPAPSSLSTSKSMLASPVFSIESPTSESVKQVDSSNATGSNHSPSTSRGRARALKWKAKEIYSISHPNPISNGNRHGAKSERATSLPYGSVQTGAVEGPASFQSYYGEHPSLNSKRASRVNNTATTGYSMPSSNAYFPPTPATPYASHNPYDASVYYAAPTSPYPQVMPSHAYPYSTTLPYSQGQYAYGPYHHAQSHGYHAQSHGYHAHTHSQPTYYWMPPQVPAENQEYWSARHSYSSPTPPAPSVPTKRPLLRYSGGVWCKVDSPASEVLAVGTAHCDANGWVKPTPHGIPTPLLKADVKVEEKRGSAVEAGGDVNGWVAPRNHVDRNGTVGSGQQDATSAVEDGPMVPRRIFVGEVALGSESYSDNVRFNAAPHGVSFGPGDETLPATYS